MSDDDFVEALLELDEALVSMELALLPFLWCHENPAVQGHLELRSREMDSRLEQVRLLAGLQGLVEVTIGEHGPLLTLKGRFEGQNRDGLIIGLLPLVAALWTLWADASRLRLEVAVAGSTREAEMDRGEFPLDDSNPWRSGHRLALLMRSVYLRESANPYPTDEELDVRFVVLVGCSNISEAVKRLLEGEQSDASDLQGYLRWMREDLSGLRLSPDAQRILGELVHVSRTLARHVGILRAGVARRDVRLATQAEKSLRESLIEVARVLDRASRFLT